MIKGLDLVPDVNAAIAGDADAFERLFNRTRKLAIGIARARLGDGADCDDAVQEAFIRASKYIKRLSDPKHFLPWLFKITANISLDMKRKRLRVQNPLRDDQDFYLEKIPDREHFEHGNCTRLVGEIGKLPSIYSHAIIEHHVNERPYDEVAREMGCTVKTLEVRLVRARKMLQRRLGIDLKRGRKRDPVKKIFAEMN